MSIIEAESLIPRGDNMSEAFDVVRSWYPKLLLSNFDRPRLVAAASYFLAGVGFLANRGHDGFIQEIGTSAWQSIRHQRTGVVIVDNDTGSVLRLFFRYTQVGIESYEDSRILIPLGFVSRADSHPIDTLLGVAAICSQVRYHESGLSIAKQPDNLSIGTVAKAHLLNEVLRRHPEFRLTLTEENRNALDCYPQGIYSLPPEVRFNNAFAYRGHPEDN